MRKAAGELLVELVGASCSRKRNHKMYKGIKKYAIYDKSIL